MTCVCKDPNIGEGVILEHWFTCPMYEKPLSQAEIRALRTRRLTSILDVPAVEAKLSALRDDAVKALDEYLYLRACAGSRLGQEQVRVAGSFYVTAQARYVMALMEAQQGSILGLVELPV